jgi:hypothetical protein
MHVLLLSLYFLRSGGAFMKEVSFFFAMEAFSHFDEFIMLF